LKNNNHSIDEPFISVVIPVFNEQARIAETLFAVKNHLRKQPYHSEVIVVDDGSSDTTAEVVRIVDHYLQEFRHLPRCVLLSNLTNTGKGSAIARGCGAARGKQVLFMDADNSTPIAERFKLHKAIEQGHDVAIGVRGTDGLSSRPRYRAIGSQLFRLLNRVLGLPHQGDTQCGFKLYKREAIQQLIARQTSSRWCFDVEHLHIAEQLGLRIARVPVQWHHQSGSKLSFKRDGLKILASGHRHPPLHCYALHSHSD